MKKLLLALYLVVKRDLRMRYNIYSDIDTICKKYGIENYTINNGLVNVDGDVNLSDIDLYKLPLTFGIVTGNFYCDYNKLTSLEGSPIEVGLDFYCSNNQLTSLEGSPREVGRDFGCYSNKLSSLKGSPKEVAGDFNCSINQLTSLEGSPKEVGVNFYCYNNKLTSLEGSPKEVGGNFECSDNQLASLKGDTRKVGGIFYCGGSNNLPELFNKYISNESYCKEILKWQEDYSIWRNDGSLDEYRFKELIKDIEDNDL